MKCPECGLDNKAGRKFCSRCGAGLYSPHLNVCRKCGFRNEPDDVFCGDCGAKLGEDISPGDTMFTARDVSLEDMYTQLQSLIPKTLAQKYLAEGVDASSEEKRFVTALFAEISGFDTSEGASPEKTGEAMLQTLQDCFKQLISIVVSYEGSISGFRGNTMLALFGAGANAIEHENDAKRAILAAIDMQEALGNQRLNISGGINTAHIQAYKIPALQLPEESERYGTDINLARKLQEAAKPGQILVGAGCYRLTRRDFDFETLHPLHLKGFPQPVPVYAVLRHTRGKTRPTREGSGGTLDLHVPLVGRESEFEELKEAVDQWLEGHGQIVSIIGEAGVGKSRLVSELRDYLDRRHQTRDVRYETSSTRQGDETTGPKSQIPRPVSVLQGRSVWMGYPVNYGPFLDVLRSYFGIRWPYPYGLMNLCAPEGGGQEDDLGGEHPSEPRGFEIRGRTPPKTREHGFGEAKDVSEAPSLEGGRRSDAASSPRAPADASTAQAVMAREVREATLHLFGEGAEEVLPFLGNLLSIRFGNHLDERLKFATPEQVRHQTLMRLRDFFKTLATEQPLLLILEDLHLADDRSIELLSLLMDELATTPLMLICVYEGEERRAGNFLLQLSNLAQRKCMDRYTEIELTPLSDLKCEELIDSFGIEDFPASLRDIVIRKSSGNPLFVKEMIRLLIDTDMVYSEGERWRAGAEKADVTVPDTIEDIILARAERLQPEVKYVLQFASVIGHLFSYGLLEIGRTPPEDLDAYLNQLVEREFISGACAYDKDVEYAFENALTRDAIYWSIPERQRMEFHYQVAIGMEQLCGKYPSLLWEHYEELAHHYSNSDTQLTLEKAVDYLLKAGEKTKQSYANEVAIFHFQKALELLEQRLIGHELVGGREARAVEPRAFEKGEVASAPVRRDSQRTKDDLAAMKLKALSGLGEVYLGMGKAVEAEQMFDKAIGLAREMGLPPRELVRLYDWIAEALYWQIEADAEK